MDSINTVAKDVINLMDNTMDKVMDDFSDDSIDPQIEYDLIINENTSSFGSLFATTQDIPIETTTEVIVESIGDQNDVKQPSEETTIEDKDNDLNNQLNEGSGDPQNSVKEESISDSKTKRAKKSSEKTKTSTSKIKESKGKTPLIGGIKKSLKSTPKTDPKDNSKDSKDIKKKSVPKRVKSIDKKYKTKKKSVEMSAEFLEQIFGKTDDHSTDGKQTDGTNHSEYESMYSKQCEEWFQRQTRHKKYNFSE